MAVTRCRELCWSKVWPCRLATRRAARRCDSAAPPDAYAFEAPPDNRGHINADISASTPAPNAAGPFYPTTRGQLLAHTHPPPSHSVAEPPPGRAWAADPAQFLGKKKHALARSLAHALARPNPQLPRSLGRSPHAPTVARPRRRQAPTARPRRPSPQSPAPTVARPRRPSPQPRPRRPSPQRRPSPLARPRRRQAPTARPRRPPGPDRRRPARPRRPRPAPQRCTAAGLQHGASPSVLLGPAAAFNGFRRRGCLD
jgi:hypothetical protein